MTTISEIAVAWHTDRDGDPYTDATYEIDGTPAASRVTGHLMPAEVEHQLIGVRQAMARVKYAEPAS